MLMFFKMLDVLKIVKRSSVKGMADLCKIILLQRFFGFTS